MVVGPGLLRVGHDVGPALVGDLDVALFDVDVGCPVLAHGPELDQMDVAVLLRDGVEEVERADHVVHLRVDGVLAVDHRVRGRALLREVHDGLGFERVERAVDERVVGQVAHEHLDGEPGDLTPPSHPLLEAGHRDQAVHAHLEVVAPPGEVVDHTDSVPPSGQVQRCRPPQIAVAPEYQNVHGSTFLSLARVFGEATDQPCGLASGSETITCQSLDLTEKCPYRASSNQTIRYKSPAGESRTVPRARHRAGSGGHSSRRDAPGTSSPET